MDTLYQTEETMKMQQILEFQLSLLRMMSRLENPRPSATPSHEAARDQAMAALVAHINTRPSRG